MLNKAVKGNDISDAVAKNANAKKETLNKKEPVSKKVKILTEEDYESVMQLIDAMMRVGEDNLNAEQMKELHALSVMAESFEDREHPLPVPAKLPDVIELRLFQMKINRSRAAELLGVSDAKFSLLMNAKQKPDVDFLAAVNTRLKVDGNFLLHSVSRMSKTRKAISSETNSNKDLKESSSDNLKIKANNIRNKNT